MSQGSIVFDDAAGYYDETRGFPPGESAAVAELFVRAGRLEPASRVLEVGVGTGRIALPLARHVARYVGIDLSRRMMARLRAKQADEPVSVLEGDITRLPVADGSVDAVVAVHIFHLVPGWREGMAEAARVLRPGGLLLAGRNDGDRPPEEDLLWQAWDEAIWAGRFENVGVPRERYEDYPVGEGWEPVGEKQVHHFTVTRPLRSFIDSMEGRVWSSTWRMSDDEVARGVAAARAAVEEHGLSLEQPVTHPRRFVVQAYRPPAR